MTGIEELAEFIVCTTIFDISSNNDIVLFIFIESNLFVESKKTSIDILDQHDYTCKTIYVTVDGTIIFPLSTIYFYLLT